NIISMKLYAFNIKSVANMSPFGDNKNQKWYSSLTDIRIKEFTENPVLTENKDTSFVLISSNSTFLETVASNGQKPELTQSATVSFQNPLSSFSTFTLTFNKLGE